MNEVAQVGFILIELEDDQVWREYLNVAKRSSMGSGWRCCPRFEVTIADSKFLIIAGAVLRSWQPFLMIRQFGTHRSTKRSSIVAPKEIIRELKRAIFPPCK